MKFCQLDDGEDGGPSGVPFTGVSNIFATQDAFSFETEAFNRIYPMQMS